MFDDVIAVLIRAQRDCAALQATLLRAGPNADSAQLATVVTTVQTLANSVEALQLSALAQLARHEVLMTSRGPVEEHLPLGEVGAFAVTEAATAMGTSTGAAGHKVAHGARLASAFPCTLAAMADGQVHPTAATRLVAACKGLDKNACAQVDAAMAPRLPHLEPNRVTSETRRTARRVAADQVEAAVKAARADRDVQVSPGTDGTTTWYAVLPAETSAAMWSSVTTLAAQYCQDSPTLTAAQARADALGDLVLGNVTVAARVALGVPVVTPHPPSGAAAERGDAVRGACGAASADPAGGADAAGGARATRGAPAAGGAPVNGGTHATGGADARNTSAEGQVFPSPVGCGGNGPCPVSGVDIPRIGHIPDYVVARLLSTVPLEVTRVLLDAETGVQLETTSAAYRPPATMRDFVAARDGVCRMWGCARAAAAVDLDHAVPWPDGGTTPANLAGLCRRHHRTKQHQGWRYRLEPDGTCTWTTPGGIGRVTYPTHLRLPEAGAPDTAVPESAVPESAVRKAAALDSARPETAAPATGALGTSVPETGMPRTGTPTTGTPGTGTPESAAPETGTPESAVPAPPF
jgi:hypothetical protein